MHACRVLWRESWLCAQEGPGCHPLVMRQAPQVRTSIMSFWALSFWNWRSLFQSLKAPDVGGDTNGAGYVVSTWGCRAGGVGFAHKHAARRQAGHAVAEGSWAYRRGCSIPTLTHKRYHQDGNPNSHAL